MSTHSILDQPESMIDPKSRILALNANERSALHEEQRLQFIQSIKSLGWLEIFYGVFLLWLGWDNYSGDAFDTIHLLGGLIIIAQAVWSLLSPSLNIMLFASIIMLIFGLLNLVIFVTESFHSVIVLFVGASQLWTALTTYRKYLPHKARPLTEFDLEILKLRNAARKRLNRTKLVEDGDLIEFYVKRERWRAWLLRDEAVLAPAQKKKLVFVDKLDFGFAADCPEHLERNRVHGVFRIDQVVEWGHVNALSLERFMRWSPLDETDADFVADYRRKHRIPRLLAKLVLIAGTLIIAGLILMMLFAFIGLLSYGWI